MSNLLLKEKAKLLEIYDNYNKSLNLIGKEHLSYSQVFNYLKCPFSWYLKKVKNWKEPYSEISLIGSLVHKSIESYLNKESNIRELVSQEYNNIVEYNGREHKEFMTKEQILEAVDLIFSYIKDNKLIDKYKPLLVEKKIDFILSDKYFMRNIPDLITQDRSIVDFKIKRRKPDISFFVNNFQIIYYAIAFKRVFKALPNKVILHIFVLSNTKKDGLHIKEEIIKSYSFSGSKVKADFSISKSLIEDEEYRLMSVIKAIEDKIYPKSTFLACQMCGFRDICSKYSLKEIADMPDNLKINELKKYLTAQSKQELKEIKKLI